MVYAFHLFHSNVDDIDDGDILRRRHFVNSKSKTTMCGHEMTGQEIFHAKKTRPENINCKKCKLIGRHE